MKYRFAIHPHTLVRLLVALPTVLLFAVSCVNDYDNCTTPASEHTADPVKLRFTIVTRTVMDNHTRQTRAADISGEETGTAPENYLNLAGRDIRFLLFDGEQKLLREFTPDTDITVAEGSANSNYVTYTVRATIAEPYFARAADGNLSFYIMVVANGKPYRQNAFALAPGTTTIKAIADQLVAFTLPTHTELPDGSSIGWVPSQPGEANGEYIPMAGLQQFTLPQGAFNGNNGPEGFVELSPENGNKDINMLRALAKIEVIDKIDIIDNLANAPAGRVSVEKVELLGYCATGTVLPAYGQWNRNGVLETQQVEAPTMASSLAYRAPNSDYLATNQNNALIDFHQDKNAKESREDGCPVFSVYTTEYSLAAIGDAVRPYVRVTVREPEGEVEKIYRLRLATYTNGTAGEDNNISALLRNHIYRYEITSASTELEIQYTLCPMGEGIAQIPPFN
jgi:hypothetical protein